ncbi:MAG: hypothetical protein U5K31_10430 [Balneolaceae bacterium]|nr:hypothetical protein [Balneolaceae bacterium]
MKNRIDETRPQAARGNRLRRWTGLALVLLTGFLFTSCAPESIGFAEAAVKEPLGFWYGLWHGIICPITFVISLFDSDVAIYAIYNNGAWYDFGFVLGVGTLMGGSRSS